MVAAAGSPFGQLLRYWRDARKMSQMDVALEANVSARHVSFVETGRSEPSREMVLLLADVLGVPLRERNTLLVSAGYAPIFRETDLFSPELASVRQSIEFLLERHHPYPAIAADRHWNLLLQNVAAAKLLPRFVDPAALVPPINVMRLLFRPNGMRPYIVNWKELAGVMIQRLHREAMEAASDTESRALLREALAAEGIPESWRTPDLGADPPPIVPMRVRRDGVELSFFSVLSTLGTARDITLAEIRIETFFAADAATDAEIRRLVGD